MIRAYACTPICEINCVCSQNSHIDIFFFFFFWAIWLKTNTFLAFVTRLISSVWLNNLTLTKIKISCVFYFAFTFFNWGFLISICLMSFRQYLLSKLLCPDTKLKCLRYLFLASIYMPLIVILYTVWNCLQKSLLFHFIIIISLLQFIKLKANE